MFSFNGPTVTEIAPDVYRIGVYAPESEPPVQLLPGLGRPAAPLHDRFPGHFPGVREAVALVIDPSRIRWVGFSHFESDECGTLNLWLEAAPHAEPVCSFVGAAVNVNDFASRPPKAMADGEVLATGRYQFRFCSTGQIPHGWDAGLLFEETKDASLFGPVPSGWRCRTAD